jgi:Ca2+-binding EF-hand superfamily protein
MESDPETSKLFLRINKSDSGRISKSELQDFMPTLSVAEIEEIIRNVN